MNYTLDNGLKVIRHLEQQLAGAKYNCHFALGGSTAMKGQSTKDFDVFCYPRSDEFTDAVNIIDAIESWGWQLDVCNIHTKTRVNASVRKVSSVDKPYALFTTPKGFRVDMFFMSAIHANAYPGNQSNLPKSDDDDYPF